MVLRKPRFPDAAAGGRVVYTRRDSSSSRLLRPPCEAPRGSAASLGKKKPGNSTFATPVPGSRFFSTPAIFESRFSTSHLEKNHFRSTNTCHVGSLKEVYGLGDIPSSHQRCGKRCSKLSKICFHLRSPPLCPTKPEVQDAATAKGWFPEVETEVARRGLGKVPNHIVR